MAGKPQRHGGEANRASKEGSTIVELSVYDFDGTLLAGKSPFILVRYLYRRHQLKGSNVFLIAMWGLAYKMHIPPNEAWVRGRVFRAFDGQKKEDVDEYLAVFYDEKIAHRLRESLLQRIEEDRKAGRVAMTVSATFEPITRHMVNLGVLDYQVATKMVVDDEGRYRAKVDGAPVEGEEKLAALKRFADKQFGEYGWRIAYAYSDHYSDKPLLFSADHAVAVHPDRGLQEAAKRNGWEIIED